MRAEEPLLPRDRSPRRPRDPSPAPDRTRAEAPPRPPAPRRRRRGPGVLSRLLGLLVGLALLASLGAGAAGFLLVRHLSADLPDHARLASYQPPTMTRTYAEDGRLLSEIALERRLFTPVEQIPFLVKQAFLSAEDQNFYQHRGVDPVAIARAVFTNVQQLGQGKRPVGASTITQQVAKNMLLGNEVSLTRKVREAVLASRIEQALPKDRILELYLNQIFLGQNAYGVTVAAQTYFDKTLAELTVSEAALLAALPKAPSTYNPMRNPSLAKARRDWVIERMAEDGAIAAPVAEAAKASPLGLRNGRRAEMVAGADWFSEEVRRQLIERFGEASGTAGLEVRTSLDPKLQVLADETLRNGLLTYDRERGGWRGGVAKVDAPAAQVATEWVPTLTALPPVPNLMPGWFPAAVLEVGEREAKLGWLDKGAKGTAPQPRTSPLDFGQVGWARRSLGEGRLGPAPRRMADVMAVGDIVVVELLGAEAARGNQPARAPRLVLRQPPSVEGAIVVMETATGRVRAISGGWSFERSQYNRATQAQRQPGSSFKPFVYLAALERNWAPTRRVLDAPFVVEQGNGQRWRPGNYGRDFGGPTTLRVGIEKSRNLMTIRLADQVGLDAVADVARRFGVVENMPHAHAAALGSVETTVLKLTAAYATIGNGGVLVVPSLVDRIADRSGRELWRAEAPSLRVMDAETVYQMTSMLQGVVARGTGGRAQIGRPVAGKTGTSNDFRDAWFVGFTPDLTMGVWMGHDEPRNMGEGEAGGRIAAPLFGSLMKAAHEGRPVRDFVVPPGIRFESVDLASGRPVALGTPGAISEAFKDGQGPDNGPAEPDAAAAAAGGESLGGVY